MPSALSTGKISGIKGRGGFEFNINWNNGELASVQVKSLLGNKLNLRYNGSLIRRETSKDEILSFMPEDFK